MSAERARPNVKTRRPHRKVRSGCSECKRRHIKCDETRPACVNCSAATLVCPYSIAQSNSLTSESTSRSSGTSNAATPSKPSQIQCCSEYDASHVNMVHLRLFNHFVTDTCLDFTRTPEHAQIYRDGLLESAFAHPFVMHELLALAALHLYTKDPETNSAMHLTSTALQSKALAGLDTKFNSRAPGDCLTNIFFTHLLGVHSFCDLFVSTHHNFGEFLTDLISSMKLLRGVQAMIRPSYDEVSETGMGELLRDARERRGELLERTSPNDHLVSLYDMIAAADISESSRNTYQETISRLEPDYYDYDRTSEPVSTTNTVFSWLMTSTSEYITLLDERRPEALVILSHYAVILHKRRNSWVIGNAGRYIHTSVLSFLGERWSDMLVWPTTEILETEAGMTPSIDSV